MHQIDNFSQTKECMPFGKRHLLYCIERSELSCIWICIPLVLFIFSTQPASAPPSPFAPDTSNPIFPRRMYPPSVFGGCIPALSPILSRRQLQTRRPITVSDEGAPERKNLLSSKLHANISISSCSSGNYAYRASYARACVLVLFRFTRERRKNNFLYSSFSPECFLMKN